MHVTNQRSQATHEDPAQTVPSPQLVKAANSFEANFLGELLKPMREDPLFGDGSDLGGDSLGSDGPGGAMGTIGNLASEAFAQAIAKQGGLGIAKQVLAELGPIEASRSQQAMLLTGPECSACTASLSMGTEARTGVEAGSIKMLAQGSLPALQADQVGKEGTEEPAKGSASERESKSDFQPIRAVRAIEHVR